MDRMTREEMDQIQIDRCSENGKPRRKRSNQRAKGRFQVANDFCDASQKGLTGMARATWWTLWRETKSNGLVQISHGQLAERMGINRRTAIKTIHELRKAGLVEVIAKGNSFENKPTIYRAHGTKQKGRT